MKVLIVDDDPDVWSFLSDGVKAIGADVIHTAESGKEALAKAIQIRYDLVTLDIKMSGGERYRHPRGHTGNDALVGHRYCVWIHGGSAGGGAGS